ncbi:MAG: thioredoxin family protein [Akkermansiaceae bacterium]
MISKVLLLSFCLAASGFGEWLTDLKKAKNRAAEEEKDLYLVFTGSDWSQSCQRFDREVLSRKKFQEAVASNYLLVRIDMPLRSNLPKEKKAAQRKLANRFGVETWPQAIYLDFKGRPFYRENGVLPLSAEEYAAHILAMRAERISRDAAFEEADKLEGLARAKAIVDILEKLPRASLLEFYPDQVSELERLDSGGSLGFLKARRSEEALARIERSLPDLFNHRSFDALIERVDAYLAAHQPKGAQRQQALSYKMAAFEYSARPDSALELAREILAIDRKSDFGRSADRLVSKLGKE